MATRKDYILTRSISGPSIENTTDTLATLEVASTDRVKLFTDTGLVNALNFASDPHEFEVGLYDAIAHFGLDRLPDGIAWDATHTLTFEDRIALTIRTGMNPEKHDRVAHTTTKPVMTGNGFTVQEVAEWHKNEGAHHLTGRQYRIVTTTSGEALIIDVPVDSRGCFYVRNHGITGIYGIVKNTVAKAALDEARDLSRIHADGCTRHTVRYALKFADSGEAV